MRVHANGLQSFTSFLAQFLAQNLQVFVSCNFYGGLYQAHAQLVTNLNHGLQYAHDVRRAKDVLGVELEIEQVAKSRGGKFYPDSEFD